MAFGCGLLAHDEHFFFFVLAGRVHIFFLAVVLGSIVVHERGIELAIAVAVVAIAPVVVTLVAVAPVVVVLVAVAAMVVAVAPVVVALVAVAPVVVAVVPDDILVLVPVDMLGRIVVAVVPHMLVLIGMVVPGVTALVGMVVPCMSVVVHDMLVVVVQYVVALG